MIYCTMCIGEEWVDIYSPAINKFSRDREVFVLTDQPDKFECNTILYERDIFSYYEKINLVLNLIKSHQSRVTYIDVNELRTFNSNITTDDNSLFCAQLFSWEHMEKYFLTESTKEDVYTILDKIKVKELKNFYIREHIFSFPFSKDIDDIINDAALIQPFFEEYFNNVPYTPHMERYSREGVGYAEGFAIQALAIRHNIDIKQMEWVADEKSFSII